MLLHHIFAHFLSFFFDFRISHIEALLDSFVNIVHPAFSYLFLEANIFGVPYYMLTQLEAYIKKALAGRSDRLRNVVPVFVLDPLTYIIDERLYVIPLIFYRIGTAVITIIMSR